MSNLSDLLNAISKDSVDVTDVIGALLGFTADISGAIGMVGLIDSLLNPQVTLQDIDNAIRAGFAQQEAENQAAQILAQNASLFSIFGQWAWPALQGLKSEILTQPTPAEANEYIVNCLRTLDAFNSPLMNPGQAEPPTLMWNLTAGWPIYWTDAGENLTRCDYFDPPGYSIRDPGYGPQNPPLNPDDITVYYYVYALPIYVYAVAIFITVGLALAPSTFATAAGYGPTLSSPATGQGLAEVLKAQHDLILKSGIVELSPYNWVDLGLLASSCPRYTSYESRGPTPGVTLVYTPLGPGEFPTSAIIEYGAVERYSGYSSVGESYTLTIQNLDTSGDKTIGNAALLSGDQTIGNAALFGKLQIRLMKRVKDVYVGVGLLTVWNTINAIKTLVGDPVLAGPSMADWSLRQVFETSSLPSADGTFSLRKLAQFLITTPPFDTPYSGAPASTSVSVRELLTNFSD